MVCQLGSGCAEGIDNQLGARRVGWGGVAATSACQDSKRDYLMSRNAMMRYDVSRVPGPSSRNTSCDRMRYRRLHSCFRVPGPHPRLVTRRAIGRDIAACVPAFDAKQCVFDFVVFDDMMVVM